MLRFAVILENVSPHVVLLGAALVGIVLTAASYPVGISSLVYNGKDVGYWSEINWWLNYILFVPVLLFFCLSTYQAIPRLLAELQLHGMLIDRDGQIASLDKVQNRWHQTLRIAAKWCTACSILALGICLYEGYLASPFLRFATLAEVPPPEPWKPFWGWGALLNPTNVSPWANGVFNFLAFLAQASVAAAILSFLIVICAFATFIDKLSRNRKEALHLIPNPDSTDSRKGFELFETFMEQVLLTGVTCFLVCYCVRVQMVYKKSASYTSLDTFLGDTMVLGFVKAFPNLANVRDVIFDIGGSAVTYSEAMVVPGVALVAFMILLSVIWTLRRAAKESRANLDADLRTGRLRGRWVSPEARMNDMTYWPMPWKNLNEILLWLLFAILCMVYYRNALLLLGYGIWILISQVWARASGWLTPRSS